MLFANVLAFHTGLNRNRSSVTEDAAKKAMKELAYKPVLANFCEIDGVRDFTSHDFDIDEDGNYIYHEKQIGCFTADKPRIEKDSEREGRMNVFAKVAIPRQYTDAAEIIERKGGTNVSVELAVNELSWDTKDKTLVLNDIDVMGLTCLGTDPDSGEPVMPGMEGAHIQIEDFSVENNSITFNSNIINDIADAVVTKLSNMKTTERRKGQPMDFEEKEIEEVTEPQEVTELMEETTEEETPIVETEASDEVTEETVETPEVVETEAVEKTSDDNSEEAFEETSEKASDETEEFEENSEEKVEDDSAEEVADSGVEEFEDETTEEDPVDDDEQEPGYLGKKYEINYTVTCGDEVKTFSVSLVDKLTALSELVNATYSEADNAWYDVDAYDEDKIVIFHDYWNNRHYRQAYSVKKDVYALKGDRVQVYCTYLTKDEQAQLDNMKATYADVSERLEKYESEPDKMNILNSSDYANIADQSDFVELKKQENHFNLTVDEIKDKADAMLLAYAKSGKLNFAATPEKEEEPKKDFFAFARFQNDTSFLDRVLKEKR